MASVEKQKQPLASALPIATANSDVDVHQLRKVLSKYALPSASELRHLHAADPTNSYRSSFFRLQIEQLLEAVQSKPSAKASAGIQSLLFQVKNILDAMPEQQVTQEALQAKGLFLRNHVKRKEIVLPFQKPSRLDVVGSFILKNMAYAKRSASEYGVFTVDIAVEMPAACFLPKDFANYRYMDKRNLYLGVLVAEMQAQSALFRRVTLAGFNGEYEKPVALLHVNPSHLSELGIKGTKMCIRLLPVITTDVFKLSKLAPSRNNIRHDPSMTEAEMRACSTPLYNNAILEDMMVRQHTRELHAALTESPHFAEACILAKVWIRQRGFHRMHDSLNGFLVSMLLLFLYAKKRISAQTSSDQMFKVLLQFIASHKLEDEPLQFPPAEGGVVLTTEGLHAFRSSFDVVFLDSSGRLNLFGRVTKSAWSELRNCAKDSIQLVQHCTMDDFRTLFIKKSEFWTRYDQYFWFPAPAPVDDADDETYTVDEKRQINDLGLERFFASKLGAVLTRALTDRVDVVRPILDTAVEWTMHGDALPPTRKVAVGLRIDPDNAWRIVDKGPAADDKAASQEFRAFWRGKSELRRFKDGAIIEAVVWDEISPDTKHHVLDAIVRYITVAHCTQLASAPSTIKNSNASLYSALNVEEVPAISAKKSSGVSASFESTMNSVSKLWVIFNGFSKTLRDLDSLPLKVVDVIPVHPGFRNTSLFPVQPHPFAFSKGEQMVAAPMAHVSTVLEPLVLHVKFERSSSWPSEKDALLHAKTGFYVQIAHELETHKKLRCDVARDCLDVFVSGFAFRLVIHSERELGIVTGALGVKKVALVHSPEYVATKQDTAYLSTHANTIHALHSKNTSFGPTVRLAQRWLADKFLSNALRLEVIELLVAHTFISASATSTPHSVLSGFLRFLKLLASFDWQQVPLAVDLNSGLDDEKRREIVKRFEASSVSPLTHPAMYIAADYEDMDCLSSWTRFSPNKVVVQRLVALAQKSYDALVHWLGSGASSAGWKPAFASSKLEFDVILELAVDSLPAKKMKIDDSKKQAFASPVYKNMNLTTVPVMIGFDPVQQLLDDLTAKFGHLALFFFNGVERSAILLTWKPQAFLPIKFRAITSHLLTTLPKALGDDDEGDDDNENGAGDAAASSRAFAIPNVFEVLSEIQRLGDGMIESVEVHPFHRA